MTVNRDGLRAKFQSVRAFTEALCEPLATEDCVVQSMPDASPAKWHLAHTSWFFETFVLKSLLPGYEPFHPAYAYLFNSYYVQAGDRFFRPHRGLLSRPTVEDVLAYRRFVDEHVLRAFDVSDEAAFASAAPVIELGLNHEQQHQELLLTDIKHVFSINPMEPVYRNVLRPAGDKAPASAWVPFHEGLHWIGHGGEGFAYDNEAPRHRVFLRSYALASRPVTSGEYLTFIEDGGYDRAELWLSDGWDRARAEGWRAPLYWEKRNDGWWTFTLSGMRPVDMQEPVCHVSYFEAEAYARWAGVRLPTEAEWETAACASGSIADCGFVENGLFHPSVAAGSPGSPLDQMFGDVWEWTASPYTGYPGYRPPKGVLGEYNGKFMSGQMVLRGGSCATSMSHIRSTYRNFFAPHCRWQFMGFRLAKEV